MTHAYLPEFLGGCWCRQLAGHHDHTGTWAECPCSRCELDRENADLFGWFWTLMWQDIDLSRLLDPPNNRVPETFRAYTGRPEPGSKSGPGQAD